MNFILSLLANASLLSASFSANAGCFILFYEPKMPEEARKLIKH